MSISRRQFLRNLVLVGAAAATPGIWRLVRPARIARAAERPKRQWAMVIDLRKCEGCTTIGQPPKCSDACVQVHNLRPEQPWLRVYEVKEGGASYFQPTPCMHCEDAPCQKVCPVGATFHDDAGNVLIDNRVCIGCRMCMAACPYGVRTFNWQEPLPLPAGVRAADYTPENSMPQRRGTPSKCMFCAHKTHTGELPTCAEACPMHAIYFGDLVEDVATNGKELVRLSDFLVENHSYQLKPELGTRPRVWYLPGHGEAFGRGHEG